MSRHRDVRNLDEDDYYDDYDDDDDYYLEQQKEQQKDKERKKKEAVAKKAKENKLKQQQQQQQANKKEPSRGFSVAAGGGGTHNNNNAGGAGKLSAGTAGGAKPGGISVGALGGKTKQAVKNHGNQSSMTPASASSPSAAGNSSSPQMPPELRTYLQSTNVRSHLSMIVLGHVDAGKSTLTGRLLLQLGHVDARLVAKYRRESANVGKSSFALAWVTDEDDSERERGVTMDVGTKFARTDRHDFTVLDAPGHRDFVPNMINGAACADCGLLVAAATTGEFEAGFASSSSFDVGGGRGGENGVAGGQTREHVVLARGLGVSQLVVAVNKLDAADPPWSQERFNHVRSSLRPFLIASGFRSDRITFVPCSGLTGANVQSRSSTGRKKDGGKDDGESCEDAAPALLASWYDGPTLIEALDGLSPAKRDIEKPLRVILSDVRPEGRSVSARGRIVQGWIRAGDSVAILPVGDVATVVRVERGRAADKKSSPYSYVSPDGDDGNDDLSAAPQNCASAGDTVELALSGIDPARLGPGCILSHSPLPLRPLVRRGFIARVVVMDRLPVPILRGSQLLLHAHGVDVPATVRRLIETKRRGESTPRKNPRVLAGGSSALVEIVANERIVLEEYGECKSLGRFVLRRGGDTVAVGLIEKVLGEDGSS